MNWWFTKTKVFSPDGLAAWVVWLAMDVDGVGELTVFDKELSADIYLDLVAFSHPSNNEGE